MATEYDISGRTVRSIQARRLTAKHRVSSFRYDCRNAIRGSTVLARRAGT